MSSIGDWYLGPGDRWVYDPDAPDPAPEPTSLNPIVRPPREAELGALHGDDLEDDLDEPFGDVGDWIDPNAPDPTPPEVVDPHHPDYVDPWRPA